MRASGYEGNACFYAVQALLLKHHMHGKTFNTLFEKRHSSDYEAFAYCDKDMVDELTPMAEAFVDAVKKQILP